MTSLLLYHLISHVMHLTYAFGDSSPEVDLTLGCTWIIDWQSSRSWASLFISWYHGVCSRSVSWIIIIVEILIIVDMLSLNPLPRVVLDVRWWITDLLNLFQAICQLCFNVCLRSIFVSEPSRSMWTMTSLFWNFIKQEVIWHLFM